MSRTATQRTLRTWSYLWGALTATTLTGSLLILTLTSVWDSLDSPTSVSTLTFAAAVASVAVSATCAVGCFAGSKTLRSKREPWWSSSQRPPQGSHSQALDQLPQQQFEWGRVVQSPASASKRARKTASASELAPLTPSAHPQHQQPQHQQLQHQPSIDASPLRPQIRMLDLDLHSSSASEDSSLAAPATSLPPSVTVASYKSPHSANRNRNRNRNRNVSSSPVSAPRLDANESIMADSSSASGSGSSSGETVDSAAWDGEAPPQPTTSHQVHHVPRTRPARVPRQVPPTVETVAAVPGLPVSPQAAGLDTSVMCVDLDASSPDASGDESGGGSVDLPELADPAFAASPSRQTPARVSSGLRPSKPTIVRTPFSYTRAKPFSGTGPAPSPLKQPRSPFADVSNARQAASN